jgi:hypothetical protein
MNDPGVGRHNPEVLKRFLSPTEECVTFSVPSEFERGVEVGGISLGVVIDLHGVINDEFHRLQWIDLLWIATEPHDAIAHGCEIDDGRYAGKILQQHAGRREGNFFVHAGGDVPARQGLHMFGMDESAILTTQQVLEQDLQRVRQPGDATVTRSFEGGKTENVKS